MEPIAGDPQGNADVDHPGAITRMVVHASREFAGRGPTKVRTSISMDVVSVVMHDTLTKSEQLLIGHGQGDAVIALRRAVQQAMRSSLVDGVEQITGRRVMAFFSDHQLEPDVALEAFVLEPEA